MKKPIKCSFPGCDKSHEARGLCTGHYKQKRRGQELRELRPGMPLEDRFWSKVDKQAPGGCWEWTAVTLRGYGRFSVGGRSGGMVYAHRFSWQLAHGQIPDGIVIDHRCANPPCVNPDHLRAVTQGQNMQHLSDKRTNNISGVRGVSWHKQRKAWRAQVTLNGRQYFGGLHPTVEAASIAVKALRAQLHTHDDYDVWINKEGSAL